MTIGRDTQISQLNSSSSFYDWFLKENDEIISKLNLMNTFTVEGINGITAPINTSGKASIGLSGKVDQGISFNGPAYFNAFTAIPNVAVKVPQINSTVSGFTFGTPVRVYWDIDTKTVKYEPAKGSDPDQAEVMGVISQITSTHSYVTLLGKIDGDFSAVNSRGIGLTAGWIYFVDPGTTGSITDVEPTATGHVSKPVIMGLTGDSGLVLQMRGNYLNPLSIPAGITGSNTLILQCDKNLGPTLTVGMFASMYNLNSDEKNKYFTNRKVYNAAGGLIGTRPVDVAKIINTTLNGRDSYLAPAIATYNEYGYNKLGPTPYTVGNSGNILGYIEDISTDGVYYYYKILTSGFTKVKPYMFDDMIANQVLDTGAGTITITPSNNGVMYFTTSYEPDKPVSLTNFQFIPSPDVEIQRHAAMQYYGNNFIVLNKYADKVQSPTPSPAARSIGVGTSSVNGKQNYLINGNFNIWQRDYIGKNTAYTSTGNIIFADLWRRRDGITGSNSTKSYSIVRREFDEYQFEVEGNPQYYIDVKALGLSAAGISGSGYTFTDHYLIGHVIPGAKVFDKNTIAFKFYGKCSTTGYPLDIYLNRYSGNKLLDYTLLGTVTLSNSWESYVAATYISALENNAIDIDLDDDYCEIGIDLFKAISYANQNGITLGQELTFSLASFACEIGNTNPIAVYPEYTEQLKYCQKFYYSTYDKNDVIGSMTLIDATTPVQNCESMFIQPNKTCHLYKWPIQMIKTPSVSFYSPASGLIDRAYNKSASTDTALLDTIQTSGTVGYGGAYRDGRNATISGSSSVNGVNVCVNNGVVDYDQIYFHIIADADFTL